MKLFSSPVCRHHLGPERRQYPGHGRVFAWWDFIGHVRRGDLVFSGQTTEDLLLIWQDADSWAGQRSRRRTGGRPVGHTDTRRRSGAVGSVRRAWLRRLFDFDRKVEAIRRECVGENITAFAGVPWGTRAMMCRVLEYTAGGVKSAHVAQLWLLTTTGCGNSPYSPSVRGADTLGADAVHGDSQRFGRLSLRWLTTVATTYVADARYGNFFEFRS